MAGLDTRLRHLEQCFPREGWRGPLTLCDLEDVIDGKTDIDEYTNTEWVDELCLKIEAEERAPTG